MDIVNSPKKFPSKLILFGEYVATMGAPVLAIPCQKFYGEWEQGASDNTQPLAAVIDMLKSLALDDLIDIFRFESDVLNGLSFRSSIPIGYGLGSSGALTAAIFHTYGKTRDTDADELKRTLARIESIFHGKSSGIDPLVSYLHLPIYVNDQGRVQALTQPIDTTGIYLLDSMKSRSTATYVEIFQKKLSNPTFASEIKKFATLTSEAIDACKKGKLEKEMIAKISTFQFEFFREMIPESLTEIWKHGLDSGAFYLKLCGAGGGGVFLMWLFDKAYFKKHFAEQKLLSLD